MAGRGELYDCRRTENTAVHRYISALSGINDVLEFAVQDNTWPKIQALSLLVPRPSVNVKHTPKERVNTSPRHPPVELSRPRSVGVPTKISRPTPMLIAYGQWEASEREHSGVLEPQPMGARGVWTATRLLERTDLEGMGA